MLEKGMKKHKVLKIREVCRVTSLSRSSVRRLESQGLFPSKLQISPGRIGWSEDDIIEWVKAKRPKLADGSMDKAFDEVGELLSGVEFPTAGVFVGQEFSRRDEYEPWDETRSDQTWGSWAEKFLLLPEITKLAVIVSALERAMLAQDGNRGPKFWEVYDLLAVWQNEAEEDAAERRRKGQCWS